VLILKVKEVYLIFGRLLLLNLWPLKI